MITLDLLKLLKYRRFVTAYWFRRECHARGWDETGVLTTLADLGILKRKTPGDYVWSDDADMDDLASRIQTFLVCHTEEDYNVASMSVRKNSLHALFGEGIYHAKHKPKTKLGQEGYDAILELVKFFPGISPKDIADYFPHRSYITVYSAIRRMSDAGLISYEYRSSARAPSRCFPVEECA